MLDLKSDMEKWIIVHQLLCNLALNVDSDTELHDFT